MPDPFHAIIIGAGPCGLSTALSLASAGVRVTVLELRPPAHTIGGAVNLTPLALRYLDALGVGARLRPRARPVSAIDMVAQRTGGVLGRLWAGVDGVRVQRREIVGSMIETAQTAGVEIVFEARVVRMDEWDGEEGGNGGVRVTYTKDGNETVVEGDILLGCDGLHSQVRTLIDPERRKTYSGKCVANGYATIDAAEAAGWRKADGSPLIVDSTIVSAGPDASLLLTYYTPQETELYLASVLVQPEGDGSRAEWALQDKDKAALKATIKRKFAGGALGDILGGIVDKCEQWTLFPVYMLPPEGMWSKGRLLLLGDAAHAMPPMGESTAFAIEDGVLLAHVLSRRATRSVPQLIADYETLRRPAIDKHYAETMARWNPPVLPASGWLGSVIYEWMTWAVLAVMNWRTDHFGRDVRELALPE